MVHICNRTDPGIGCSGFLKMVMLVVYHLLLILVWPMVALVPFVNIVIKTFLECYVIVS
jgi:hypothetical protein